MDKKIKRKLEDFIKDEKGKVSKDKVLKTGVGVIAGLVAFGSLSEFAAASNNIHSNHNNVTSVSEADPDVNCAGEGATTPGSTHTSHSSY